VKDVANDTIKSKEEDKKVTKSRTTARPAIKKSEKSASKKSNSMNKPKAKALSKASCGTVSVRRTRRYILINFFIKLLFTYLFYCSFAMNKVLKRYCHTYGNIVFV
jgi:hypothetical protein